MARFICFAMVLFHLEVNAQKQGNIWYFGDGFGLNFNTNPPTALNNGMTAPSIACGDNHIEGTASIADSTGSLLFYSDGRTIWNKNHQEMTNGTGLLGGTSSTQAAIVVPRPSSDTEYYLLTTDDFCNDLENGLRYSLINLCSDDKLGEVNTDEKNVLLVDSVAEKLAAVRHSNGNDYWIVSHGYFSNKFYVFLLTAQGIQPPVISAVGAVHQGGGPNNMWRASGQMRISSSGDQIAVGSINGANLIELFSFNSTTGVVSGTKVISSNTGTYGLAFSPDGSKLYKTTFLTQYDLNAGQGHVDSIISSAFQYSDPQLASFSGAELGPDGKVYLYKSDNSISVIHNPNTAGVLSNAQASAYSFNSNGWVYSFPTMIAGYDYSSAGICDTLTYIAENLTPAASLSIYPNPASQSVRVEVAGSHAQAMGITITDLLGHAVLSLPYAEVGGADVNISNLANGIYTIAATMHSGETLRQRLVVQH